MTGYVKSFNSGLFSCNNTRGDSLTQSNSNVSLRNKVIEKTRKVITKDTAKLMYSDPEFQEYEIIPLREYSIIYSMDVLKYKSKIFVSIDGGYLLSKLRLFRNLRDKSGLEFILWKGNWRLLIDSDRERQFMRAFVRELNKIGYYRHKINI